MTTTRRAIIGGALVALVSLYVAAEWRYHRTKVDNANQIGWYREASMLLSDMSEAMQRSRDAASPAKMLRSSLLLGDAHVIDASRSLLQQADERWYVSGHVAIADTPWSQLTDNVIIAVILPTEAAPEVIGVLRLDGSTEIYTTKEARDVLRASGLSF